MAKTFKALSELADWNSATQPTLPEMPQGTPVSKESEGIPVSADAQKQVGEQLAGKLVLRELHYNIQIVLPETRDPAVFDAIFSSLKTT